MSSEINLSTILSVSNPVAINERTIDVEIDVDGIGVVGYTAAEWGSNETSTTLFERAKAGEYGELDMSRFKTEEQQRKERAIAENDDKLSYLTNEANAICQPLAEEKDLGIISDEDLARYKAWAVYRQKLRKVDLNAEDVIWPEKPE